MIDVEFLRICRRRTDVVKIHFVRLQLILQEVIPVENRVLVRIHEAGARLHIESRVFLLN